MSQIPAVPPLSKTVIVKLVFSEGSATLTAPRELDIKKLWSLWKPGRLGWQNAATTVGRDFALDLIEHYRCVSCIGVPAVILELLL